MTTELQDTLARLERVSEERVSVEDLAKALKAIADTLRADVEALTKRVEVIERGESTVAKSLITEREASDKRSDVQNQRLDELES
jgi:archaellum component FlaC